MESSTEKKWYQKPTAVILLLLFVFPIGLFLMWKHQVWSKTTRWIISGVCILFAIASSGSSLRPCDCLEAMVTSNEVYNKCLLQDIDKAFDYWQSRDPNRKFQNSEAVIQAYWMEKCYQ